MSQLLKSFLIHLSMNMWEDCAPESLKNVDVEQFKANYPHHYMRMGEYTRSRLWSDSMTCDDGVWTRVTERFAKAGGNMLLIDLGDAVKYHSHPEIATIGAWSTRRLRNELERCRDLGLEVIPKLNLSACHDAWMHDYARMVSTPAYYRFCRDIIEECCELFDGPRFFHVGMDEETYADQDNEGHLFRIVRSDCQWWDDLNFYFEETRRNGARPMMWSDKLWSCDEKDFTANVGRDVVQCNWYYKEVFDFNESTPAYLKPEEVRVKAYKQLERLGYDILGCASNWACLENYKGTVEYCSNALSSKHLLGYMMTTWYPTNVDSEKYLNEACDLVAAAHGAK